MNVVMTDTAITNLNESQRNVIYCQIGLSKDKSVDTSGKHQQQL